MFNKKTILIIVVVLALVAIVSVVFLSSKKNNTATEDATNGSTNSSGDLTNVTASPTGSGRGFVVKVDPTQPYVSINPRGFEPITTTPTGQSFTDYDKAVASGLIPDKDGLYRQNANPNYDPTTDGSKDYSLSSTEFLNAYYGSTAVNNVISGNSPFDQALNSAPGAGLVVTDASVISAPPVDATVNSGVVTIADNSSEAIKNYYLQLSSAIADMDLVNDLDVKYFALANAQSPQELAQMKSKVETVKQRISKIKAPSTLLGMSQHYYGLYAQFSGYIDNEIAMFSTEGPTQSDVDALSGAYTSLVSSLSQIKDDLAYVKQVLKG